jgi:hypothetical protein
MKNLLNLKNKYKVKVEFKNEGLIITHNIIMSNLKISYLNDMICLDTDK